MVDHEVDTSAGTAVVDADAVDRRTLRLRRGAGPGPGRRWAS